MTSALLFVCLMTIVPSQEGCLQAVATREGRVITEKDRELDSVSGNHISCGIAMMPSDVDQTLLLLRDATLNGESLESFFDFPFWFDPKTRPAFQVTKKNFRLYEAEIRAYLSSIADMIDMGHLESAGWRGVFIDDGRVWMNSYRPPQGGLILKISAIDLPEAERSDVDGSTTASHP